MRSISFLLLITLASGWPAEADQAGIARVVLATVLDARGRSLLDVDADDFVVEESGEPREVFGVRIADYPVVLLLDTGGAAPDLDALKKAAVRFVTRIGDRPVALGTLTHPTELFTTFEDNREAVLTRIESLTHDSTNALAPLEAMAAGAQAIAESGSPFSAIVVVSTRPYASTAEEPAALVTPILESAAIVHAVVRQPGSIPAPLAGDNTLRELTERTHGQFAAIFSAGSYVVALDRIADRMASEFAIEYLVPQGAPLDPSVRLGVRVPGARVQGLGVAK
jgi:hypothetical protein